MLEPSLFSNSDQELAATFFAGISKCKGVFFLDRQIRSAISRIHRSSDEKHRLLDGLNAVMIIEGVVEMMDGEHFRALTIQRNKLLEQVDKIDTNYFLMRYMDEKKRAEACSSPQQAYTSLVQRWTSETPSASAPSNRAGPKTHRKKPPAANKRSCTACGRRCKDSTSGECVCPGCGLVQKYNKEASSFEDVQRLTTSKKYTYERATHFKDTMAQYQGTQTDNVPDRVYQKLRLHLSISGLVNNRAKTKADRYARVTRSHIWRMLSSIGCTDWNEDATLIWSKITSQTPPSIACIETELYEDFMIFDEMYENMSLKIRLGRKNMINSSCMLTLLLAKRGICVDPGNLSVMRTAEKLRDHDKICRHIFGELGWKFVALSSVFTGM